MSGANDWTKEIMTKGFPELKQHYTLLGAPDKVMAKALLQFDHNYNFVSREVMYQWFNKHLELGLPEPVIEEDFQPLSIAEMSVWDAEHPRPPGGGDYERSLVKELTAESDRQLAALTPGDAASLARYRQVVGGAVDVIVGRELPNPADIDYELIDEQSKDNHSQFAALLRYKPRGEELPIIFFHPNQWNGRVVIWAHERGKAGLVGDDGQPIAEIRKLLAAGTSVVAPDLLFQGEFLADGQPLAAARRVDNPREFAGYTWGYNQTLCAAGQRPADHSVLRAELSAASPQQGLFAGHDGRGALGGRGPGAGQGGIRSRGDRHGRISLRRPEVGLRRQFPARSGQVRRSAQPARSGRSHRTVVGRRRSRRTRTGADGLSGRRSSGGDGVQRAGRVERGRGRRVVDALSASGPGG